MIPLTLEELIYSFQRAKEIHQRYVFIMLEMEGFPDIEIIINPIENADTKLDYYKKTYDENLNHKYAKGIRIISFGFSNTLEEIEENYI